MVFWVLHAALIVSGFVVIHGKSSDLNKPSDIFQKYHTAVVTVFTSKRRGTGFIINPPSTPEFVIKPNEKGYKFVITAAHVVKGSNSITLRLYQDRKYANGNWQFEDCPPTILGLDVVRDVALLSIDCDKCNCKSSGNLQASHSRVNTGEKVLVIGDSAKRELHSFIDGTLSVTDRAMSTASLFYKNIKNKMAATAFNAKFHGFIGSSYQGDSGSPVMDETGKVIGMISMIIGDLVYCVTIEEIFSAYVQIADSLSPHFVACTAHESALLGREFWVERAGKSIRQMNALGAAMDAQYIAVAHNGDEAYAFTFHYPLWEVLRQNEDVEHGSQCICNSSSFIDGEVVQQTKDGKAMCGCFEEACRENSSYNRRFGREIDRRWAIYKRMSRSRSGRGYVPSKESLASLKDMAVEIGYWKGRVHMETSNCLKEKKVLISGYEESTGDAVQQNRSLSIVTAVAVLLGTCSVLYLYHLIKRCETAERKLKEAEIENSRLGEELTRQYELQNDNTTLPSLE